ncbi:helix-turn-helix transcriptional regulator, partial [Neisseria meningitidis]|nr:helix-turn-helix transcriptional regulator [Neisseria meningitidis]
MTMHETTDRLFEIAKEQGVLKPADIAERLNISQQALKNWESRGIAA